MRRALFFSILFCHISISLFAQHYERYKQVLETSISSKYLGVDKNITVTVPMEWQTDIDKTFPLLIVFDWQNHRSHNYILNTIDYLTSIEQMPASIIVSIESTQEMRYLETSYKISNEDGLAQENEQFIFDELIPLMEEKYKASPFRLFVGHSRYGYFTSSLLFSRTNEINGIISLSPFFSQENSNLTDSIGTLRNKALTSEKYYRYGIGNDYPTDFERMENALKEQSQSIPMFNAKGYYFKEADHNATPGLTIGVSLYEIFEKWSQIQSKYLSSEFKDLSSIKSLEKEITDTYGSKLDFSLGILNGKGWSFYNEGEYDNAIKAWDVLMNAYPNFSEGYLYIIDAEINLKRDPTETIEKLKKSIQMSVIYSENEKKEIKEELRNLLEKE